MATHDIARETWGAFFDDFSRRHQGARVTVSTVSPQTNGPAVEERDRPFAGITLDGAAVRLQIGGEEHAHVIEQPTRVYHKTGPDVLMSSEVEHGEAIEITASGEPPITYLRFSRPADQETSDAGTDGGGA